MRIRTVKPEFFKHEDLFELDRETQLPCRLAYIGLWCACDREGRFKWRPRQLGTDILPYDGVDFSRVLDALLTRGFLVRYRVGDEWFGCVDSFSRHQVINNRESPSVLPKPVQAEEFDARGTRAAREGHAGTGEGKGKERKGKEGGADEPPPTSEVEERVAPELTDEQWLDGLKKHDAYSELNVANEYARMQVWCETNRKKPTRRRFVNWLNRCDRPMTAGAQPVRQQTPLWKQALMLEEQINTHPANQNFIRYSAATCTPEMREDLKQKRARLKELKEQEAKPA